MRLKLTKKIFCKENPYKIFATETSTPKNKNSNSNFTEPSNYKIVNNKEILNHQRKMYDRPSSAMSMSSVSRSLKSVTLNSKLYGNYINFYSSITRKHTFKKPRIDEYPLLKDIEYLPIKSRPQTAKNLKKQNISFSREMTNSVFLSYMKAIKPPKRSIKMEMYEAKSKYGANKQRFDRSKTNDSFTAGKDFGELCDINLFESKFLKQIGLKKVDMNNLFEEKQKNFNFFFEYIQRIEHLKNIFKEDNYHRNITFDFLFLYYYLKKRI